MMGRGLRWLLRQFEPREGWLPVVLLLGIMAALNWSVLDAAWVPQDDVIVTATLAGLALGVLLARRPVRARFAWGVLLAWGIVLPIIIVSRAWPGGLLFSGWETAVGHVRRELILFFVQTSSWLAAVSAGRATQETVVFAYGLGLAGWLLAAFAAWSSFRQQRPLQGITLLGMVLVVNNVYGGVPVWPVAVFVVLAVLLVADLNFLALLQGWEQRGIDYSEELRQDLLLIAVALGLVFVLVGFFVPSIRLDRVRALFYEQPVVQAAEGALQRSFAGVATPRVGGPAGGGAGGPGIMPRSFLLGNAPELAETPLFTARLTAVDGAPPGDAHAIVHWRGGSFDTYTGLGWLRSRERTETLPAQTPLPLPPLTTMTTLSQTVNWRITAPPATRLTVGRPLQFDETVTASWREPDDLVRVAGANLNYQALSQTTAATPAELRRAQVADVPTALLTRYTALPEIPARVHDLAREVTATAPTPYDQARALEQFLRQYPYTLDLIAAPPPDRDPVDYFLFELKQGYCDYYASAMVVMARSLGLPARFATGYLLQAPAENGWQTVYQLNAHAWAEIYFAGYGWIEFEPTAGAIPTERTVAGVYQPPAFQMGSTDFGEVAVPPIPETPVETPLPAWLVLLPIGLILAGVAAWLRWRQQRGQQNGVVWAFARLQARAGRLGAPVQASQTPAEFAAALLGRVNVLVGKAPRWLPLAARLRPDLERLTALFARQQYDPRRVADPDQGFALWQKLGRPLWLLRWRHWRQKRREN